MRASPALLLLLGVALPACSANPSADEPKPTYATPPAGSASVVIDNRSANDMDIYIQGSSGSPIRLGFVPAKESSRFTLSPGVIAGAGTVQFSARPTRGGESAVSDPFAVKAGDELNWVIPT
jgi:hypothetical protein